MLIFQCRLCRNITKKADRVPVSMNNNYVLFFARRAGAGFSVGG